MKKFLILTLIALINFTTSNAENPIVEIREELFYTDFDLDKCLSFYNKVSVYKQSSPTIAAYEAAAMALIAKHSWNPITKISNIREAMSLLNASVQKENTNLEIRFLRLYIENSLPSYVGMNDDIKEDKKMIIDNIELLNKSDLNVDIINYILRYMSTSVACTDDEIKVIQARLL